MPSASKVKKTEKSQGKVCEPCNFVSLKHKGKRDQLNTKPKLPKIKSLHVR